MEILLLPLRFQQKQIFKWTFCENQAENPVQCKIFPFDAKELTSCDACDTLNSQDILNLFLKRVHLNETDFQKGITGSSFCCKKIIFFLGKFPLQLVELSAEDAEIREEDAEILMLQTLSEKFAKKLIQAEIIPESDADIDRKSVV